MDWHQEVVIPAESVQRALRLRIRIQRALWIGSHLPYFATVIIILAAAAIAWWRRVPREASRQAGGEEV
jgi:hypothetical protein